MVITAARPTAGFDPPAFNQFLLFEAAEDRIQRSDPKTQLATGTLFDQFADFIPVAVGLLQERKNQKLGTALLEFAAEHWCDDISVRSILSRRSMERARCCRGFRRPGRRFQRQRPVRDYRSRAHDGSSLCRRHELRSG